MLSDMPRLIGRSFPKAAEFTERNASRMIRFSLFGLTCFVSFLTCQLLGRFFYPFGDEPDFTVRAPNLILDEHSWINPYSWLRGLLGAIDYSSGCSINSSPFSLWAQIDSISCSEPLEQVLLRYIVSIMVAAPLLLIICLARKDSTSISNRRSMFGLNADDRTLDALALSLLVPGITYSLGVLAEEQLVLVLSLLLILVEGSWLLTLTLLFAILSVDLGNGVVVATLVLFLNAYRFAARRLSVRMLLVALLVQSLLTLGLGISSLSILSNVSFLADKADAMYASLSDSDLVDKYPIYLRPVITFMTGVFMTPSFIKIVPAHLLVAGSILIGTRRMMAISRFPDVGNNFVEKRTFLQFEARNIIVEVIAVIATILFFVFLFPTYSNAKYYLFAVPFLMRGFLLVASRKTIFRQLIVCQSLVFGLLILYRI